jgi:hypothetical protein
MTGGIGKILVSKQYSVWCCECDNLIDYAEFKNQKEAERDFRREGWRKAKRGWVCPRHKKESEG